VAEYTLSSARTYRTAAEVGAGIRENHIFVLHREDGSAVVIQAEVLDDLDRVFVRYRASKVPASITVGDARRNPNKFPTPKDWS